MTVFKDLLYHPIINQVLRSSLKPFVSLLPRTFLFPINGIFTVKGNGVPPFKMKTNPSNAVTKFLFWGNIEGFEFSSVKIFCEVVKDSKVFFDIGSNIGYYSLLASSIKHKQIRVFAFEPMPSIYNCLNENIQLNQFTNISAHQLALSNEKGKAIFYAVTNPKFKDFPQLTGDGGLSASHSGNHSKVQFDVTIETLDNFAKEYLKNETIDLIKLDTEANEHKVLAGAAIVLGEHRPIIQCEILKNEVEVELENILKPHRYLYYRATDMGLVKVDSFKNNQTAFVDYYLVPEEKAVRIAKFIHPATKQSIVITKTFNFIN